VKAHSRFVSFAEQRKWTYVQNGTNLGIARALNVGMKEAQKRHADYALLDGPGQQIF
jgi:GT2 family glycosyltransferase